MCSICISRARACVCVCVVCVNTHESHVSKHVNLHAQLANTYVADACRWKTRRREADRAGMCFYIQRDVCMYMYVYIYIYIYIYMCVYRWYIQRERERHTRIYWAARLYIGSYIVESTGWLRIIQAISVMLRRWGPSSPHYVYNTVPTYPSRANRWRTPRYVTADPEYIRVRSPIGRLSCLLCTRLCES